MSLATFWTKFKADLKEIFTDIEVDTAKLLVPVLQEVKLVITSGVPGFMANILDQLTHSEIPTEVLTDIQKYLPVALSTALAIEVPPASANAADILAWENSVIAAWGQPATQKDKVISVVGADLMAMVAKTNQTFAQRLTDLEDTYQDYLAAEAGGDTATVSE